MTYQKTTIISGYTIPEKNLYGFSTLGRQPTGDEVDKCCAWIDEFYKSHALAGHWSIAAAKRYARRRGWHRPKMTHVESDLSGKGRNTRKQINLSEANNDLNS